MSSTLALVAVLAVVLPIAAAGCWLGLRQLDPHGPPARSALTNLRR